MGFLSFLNILLKFEGFSLPLSSPVLIFATILFIILFAPILLNKFKIPHLIGLIIAGAFIGENGFHLINRDSSFELFGKVGLLYIMFLAGLEIDLAEFRKNSGKSLVFGMYTFIIPMILGILAGLYLLDFNIYSSMLLASIFASHTLIAYPIISKFGVTKNRAVNVTIGGTLITDTLALLVLAVVAGLFSEDFNDYFWTQMAVSVLLMGAFVMFGFPVIGRWFFKRFDDSVSQYIFVLGMVYLAAFLSEVAGVDAIIGAFLAGLALNRLVPQTSALMNRIEFVGNALFIPFFLIGIGMLINYRVFFENLNTVKVAIVITLVATLAKYIAAWLAQKTFNYTIDERRIIFGLSNARVGSALAVVLVGYETIIGQDGNGTDIRLLGESVLNGLVVLILITCTIASFVAQKGARNIALQTSVDEPIDEGEIPEKILIAINDEKMAEEMMNLSLTIKSKQNKDHLYALNIIDNDNPAPEDEKKAQKIFKIASESASATDNYVHQLKRYDLNLVNAIAGVVKEQGITDLILGLHKQKGMSDSFLGNLTSGILSKCNTTTLIYKPAQPLATIKRNIVLVPEKAEREIGFPFWLIKLWNISRNTGSKLLIYADKTTRTYIESIALKHPVPIEFKEFTDWDDFLILGRDLRKDDNLYIIMSRRNHPSYKPAMTRIPHYLNKYFSETSYVIVYPLQTGIADDKMGELKNPGVLEPLQENLGVINDIAKTMAKLFRRK